MIYTILHPALQSEHIPQVSHYAGNDLDQGEDENDQVVYTVYGGQDSSLPRIEVEKKTGKDAKNP
jgi:hypothetical protein